MLDLSKDYATEDVNSRGPPHTTRRIVQQVALFKVHCLQLKANILTEDEVRSSFVHFNLEEHHFKYRYKMLHGYFPTFKWLISPQANRKVLSRRDTYVLFSNSDCEKSLIPNDTPGVELSAWVREIRDITSAYQTLPAIVGNIKPLL